MTRFYILRRIGIFLLTIIVASTLNFAVPRLTPQDPIAALLGRMASRGIMVEDGNQIVAVYRAQFGFDQPITIQYLSYLDQLLHGDLGYSLAYFPAKVESIIGRAIPWTLGLFGVANLLAFFVGNLLGALAAWPRTARIVRYLIFGIMPLSAIPYYLLALLLLYLLAIIVPIFPVGGSFTLGSTREFNWQTLVDLGRHAALPILSIAIGLVGFWALSMRGVMRMVLGENYLIYARAKGLHERRIFARYGIRNAVLPQVTALAIDLGRIAAGQVLVEIIFNYPGVGLVLYTALATADYFVIQGVVLFLILSVAFATLVIDLVYPLLDPRVQY